MAVNLKKIKFFVEGDGDIVFVRDILKQWYDFEATEDVLKHLIIKCGGYSGIANQIDEFKQIDESKKREGGKNVVIFDADYSGRDEHHGFKEKTEYLNVMKSEHSINFEIFLFPDNKSDGTLETLLESCIHPAHKEIMNCWNGFEKCIEKNKYYVPANKSKIYVYLECLYGQTNAEKEKIKDRNRDFTNKELWNIDYSQNPYLKELKIFIDSHLL